MKLRATFSAVSVALLTLVPAAAAYQSYLQAPAVASYNVTSAGFTVECWVKVRDQPGFDPRIIRCVGPTEGPCGDSSSEVWQLWICKESACLPKGGVYFGLQDNGVCVGEVLSTVSITDGQYHHIAGTYDGAFVRVYVDGALSNSRPQSGLNVQVSGGKLVVGNSTGYNNQFDGQIDEVRIWSVARSDSQIASAMATEITPGPGLVGYWRLNGNGTDISVGGNTLVPSPNGGITFVAGQLNQAADISNPDTPPCSTLLAAAQGVAASSGERCLVRVSWQDVAGERGYRIYRNGGLAGSVAADVLQFNDQVPAGTYNYCLAAFDSCGESPRTCATGTSASLPDAQGVAASSGERCLVRVSWQDVAGETGYRIYRNGGLAGSVAADVLQFNDEVPAGTYDYCVAAYDSCGESARTCATGTSASPPAFLGTNGNYYERVTVPFFTWTASKAAAESYRFLEHPGHLATVSDGVENSFLVQLGAPNYWLGGFQSPNSPNPAANWQWVTGEPFVFTHWAGDEPNDSQPDENFLEMKDSGGGWNDVPDDDPNDGFVVEYDIGQVQSPPQGLIASEHRFPIMLTWQPGTGATGYHVYRNNELIYAVPSSVTSVNDPVIGGPYLYCVKALNPCGIESSASCDQGSGKGGGGPLPRRMTIESGPLMPRDRAVFRQDAAVTLKVQMGDRAGQAEVAVYDVRGRVVRKLFDGGLAAHAVEKVRWDGTDRDGRRAAPSVYVVRFVAPGIWESMKILYLP